MDHPKCLRVLIEGRVQGVWYRGWTVEAAQGLGLHGWVRNLTDGRVEAVFLGAPEVVDAMVEACRKGPPAARVSSVTVEPWADHPGHGFHQRATA
ncbi:MAG TPA: acylphosphatase [Magnetospirillum sp.]|nr:acylphosphatase [Magnetospirillum sp.]